MNVVGLDLSLTATGIATEAGTEVLRTDLRGCERLAWLREEVWVAVTGCTGDFVHPDLVVLEDYAYSRANQAHQIGELHGVIRLALHEAEIPVALVAPTARAKYATGNGKAGKAEVLAAAIRRLGYDGHDDNEADALWLRQMALDHYEGYGACAPIVPAVNRAALDKVDWPPAPSPEGDNVSAADPSVNPADPVEAFSPADLLAMRQHAQAIGGHVKELGHPGPRDLATADLLLLSEYVVRLCDALSARAALAALPAPECDHATYRYGCPSCDEHDRRTSAAPVPDKLSDDEREQADRLRDKLGLMRIAERQAADHDDRHADEAANDLWSSLTADMAFWLPQLLAIIDRLSGSGEQQT